MIKKIIGSATLVAMLSVSAQAYGAERYLGIGYASANIGDTLNEGLSIDLGIKFGDKIKNRFGSELIQINKNLNSGDGNIINFYYNIGYEVVEGLIPYVSMGYMFQSFSEIMSDGFSYGAGVEYEISKNFSLESSYKLSTLELPLGNKYDVSIMQVNLAYRF